MDGSFDLETVEAMACREGLALAADLMLQKLRLTTDCASVVKSIAGEGMRIYGHIIQEVKARRNDFIRVEFVHEHRDSNSDAHVIARSSIYKSLGTMPVHCNRRKHLLVSLFFALAALPLVASLPRRRPRCAHVTHNLARRCLCRSKPTFICHNFVVVCLTSLLPTALSHHPNIAY
jgi:hypothetical protein